MRGLPERRCPECGWAGEPLPDNTLRVLIMVVAGLFMVLVAPALLVNSPKKVAWVFLLSAPIAFWLTLRSGKLSIIGWIVLIAAWSFVLFVLP